VGDGTVEHIKDDLGVGIPEFSVGVFNLDGRNVYMLGLDYNSGAPAIYFASSKEDVKFYTKRYRFTEEEEEE